MGASAQGKCQGLEGLGLRDQLGNLGLRLTLSPDLGFGGWIQEQEARPARHGGESGVQDLISGFGAGVR